MSPPSLIEHLTSKQLKVAMKTWHSLEWKHLLPSQARTAADPNVSAGSHGFESRAFTLSSQADPHIYNPTAAATTAESSSSHGLAAWTSPSPLSPPPHVLPCQCGHLTAERTAPVLLSPHHGLQRGRGRAGWDWGQARRERGRGGICAAPTKRRLLEHWQKHLSRPAFTHSPAVPGPDCLSYTLSRSLSLYLECVKLSDASFGNPHP